MALDRCIALVFLVICLVYGYTAYVLMDPLLPPFMKHNPVWPSTFPKVLSVLGVVTSLIIVLGLEKSNHTAEVADINYRKLTQYKLGQALGLLGLMVFYALALRPIGFLTATTLFLVGGAAILGERRWILMVVIGAAAAGSVWYLVDQVLGIYMRPLPWFMS